MQLLFTGLFRPLVSSISQKLVKRSSESSQTSRYQYQYLCATLLANFSFHDCVADAVKDLFGKDLFWCKLQVTRDDIRPELIDSPRFPVFAPTQGHLWHTTTFLPRYRMINNKHALRKNTAY